jgi:AcrR family transcriptional regulator
LLTALIDWSINKKVPVVYWLVNKVNTGGSPAIPRNAPRHRRSATERRDDILAAALTEFATHGYFATRTADIAKRVGISQPYIYALFADKKELFLACHALAMQRLREALFQATPKADDARSWPLALDRVEAAMRELITADPTQLMFQLQAHAAAIDPQIREVVRERFMAMVDEGVRATGASRGVVLEHLARGLFFTVALALELPDEYRLPPAAGGAPRAARSGTTSSNRRTNTA